MEALQQSSFKMILSSGEKKLSIDSELNECIEFPMKFEEAIH